MPKIGLVLAGGGARGAYQLGAWKALRELKIDGLISCYSGASVGSLNAALFAMGDYQLAYDAWMSLDRTSVFNVNRDMLQRVKEEKLEIFNRGLFNTISLEKIIDDNINCDVVRQKDVFVTTTVLGNQKSSFLDLLKTNYLHYFKSENQTRYQNLRTIEDDETLKTMLLASCAIPVAFRPITIEEHTYYDGGIFDNVPYKPLLEVGCDVIIVIDLYKKTLIHKIDIKGAKSITVYPKKSLRSIMDFNHDYNVRRFELGYEDTIEALKEHLDLFE